MPLRISTKFGLPVPTIRSPHRALIRFARLMMGCATFSALAMDQGTFKLSKSLTAPSFH